MLLVLQEKLPEVKGWLCRAWLMSEYLPNVELVK